MDPSMILYTEVSPHFHSAEDAVNYHSASPWRSAGREAPRTVVIDHRQTSSKVAASGVHVFLDGLSISLRYT